MQVQAGAGRTGGSRSTRFMPKAWARRATSWAMLPKPSRPERAALEARRLRELLLVPTSGAQLGDVVGDPPVEGEDQPEGQLRDRDGSSCRGSWRRRCRAPRRRPRRSCCSRRPRARSARGWAAVHHRGGHLRRADDEHLGARCRRSASARASSLRPGSKTTSQPAAVEAVEAGLLELVGDEDLHGALRVARGGWGPR